MSSQIMLKEKKNRQDCVQGCFRLKYANLKKIQLSVSVGFKINQENEFLVYGLPEVDW